MFASPRLRSRLLALLAGGLTACAWQAPAGSASRVSPDPVREEVEPLAMRVWRAGRPISPGLAAARQAEIEAERVRAVERLGESLSDAETSRLGQWLRDEDTPEELWCASAHAAAALERYELAPELARAIEPSASLARAATARSALHALYGRWFREPAELAPYLGTVLRGAGTRLLLAAMRAEEDRARANLLAELAHRPAEAVAWLGDPDPEVRSGAAKILAQVFTREGEDQAGTLASLIAHLEGEPDPTAFHEALQACFVPLERAAVDQNASLRLRTLLIDLARGASEARSLSVAQAFARLPWRMGGPRDLGHVLTGIEALAAMLRSLTAADRIRGLNDPDPLVAVLSSLRQLCGRASAGGLQAELRGGPARDGLLEILGDARADEAVRAAAAAALGSEARTSDGARLAEVLADPSVGGQVKHALLGALGELLPELAPATDGARELMLAIAAQTGASDADLRRRALALCADARLEPLVRTLDPSFLVTRLGEETGREATLEILGLIRRFGRPEMLDGLLALERFDALCGDPRTLEAFVPCLLSLVNGTDRSAFVVAERLAAVPALATELGRLRHALSLAAELDEAAAYALAPAEHDAIDGWSWRALRAGVAPRELAEQGIAFEQRLLAVHLPRAAELRKAGTAEAGVGPFEAAHLGALLRADLFVGAPVGARGSKPEVEAAFEEAQELASTPEMRWLVLRDRARFRTATNEGVKALGDYRRLIEAGEQADPLLGLPDLRAAVGLLERLDVSVGERRSATAGEACALLTRIVLRAAWQAEPASVRMQDLRDWVRAALDAGSGDALRRLEAALADLPLTQIETQAVRDPAPVWSGLTRESAWFQELLDLRVRVRLGLTELGSQG
jgi:hypothetical protein